jgi:4'-phosphopantetheinyl transferase
VRQLLEKYLDIPATDIIFGRGVSGKPHIAGSIDLQVNLTHSANLAVLAVSKGIEIGVDVELVCGNASLLPINQLSSDEQAELRSLPSESLLNGFYACWTRKESLLKGLGIGLLGQLASFSVMPDSDRPTIHSSSDPALTSMKTWRLADLNPATGYIGALAVRVKPSKTCFFQFIANEAGRHAVD